MSSRDNNRTARQSEQSQGSTRSASAVEVVGNERMTALAGAVLLVLFTVEMVTAARLRSLLSIHVFVGVLLVGPLTVKIGSTGYRFIRYYTGSPAFVRRGPPRLALRVLAPFLLVTTLVVVGSGIGLLVAGPSQPGSLLFIHGVSSLLWLPLVAVHVFAYIWKTPRLIADDWNERATGRRQESRIRFGVNLGMLLASMVAAILVFPSAAPWVVWSQVNGNIPGPLVVGVVAAVLALLATRPFTWR